MHWLIHHVDHPSIYLVIMSSYSDAWMDGWSGAISCIWLVETIVFSSIHKRKWIHFCLSQHLNSMQLVKCCWSTKQIKAWVGGIRKHMVGYWQQSPSPLCIVEVLLHTRSWFVVQPLHPHQHGCTHFLLDSSSLQSLYSDTDWFGLTKWCESKKGWLMNT